jgi:hypothetical protein
MLTIAPSTTCKWSPFEVVGDDTYINEVRMEGLKK